MKAHQLTDWVTFVPNKSEPIHNWFYYKEGFSKKLVQWLVKDFKLREPVFDPFCGVGTTLLSCKQMNIESIGMDVSPLACLASRVKTANYDVDDLTAAKKELDQLEVTPIDRIPVDPRIKKLFYHSALETAWFYKQAIEEIKDESVREFLLLALIDITGLAANVEKVGGSLRKKKKPNFPVREMFLRKVGNMISDVAQNPLGDCPATVLEQDCRFHKLEPESISAIITSPPYLNKIEYTKIYGIELAIFFGYQQKGLRAFVGDNPKIEARPELARLPLIAQAYFSDLDRVLKNCFDALKPKGKLAMNVAGGCLPEGTVNTPQIMGRLCEMNGFVKKEDFVARSIQCMSPQGRFIGKTTENVTIFEKP